MASPSPFAGIQFRVLGPFEVVCDGVVVPLTSAKQRLLLAMLVVHANAVVSIDSLIDALWPTGAPATAKGVVRTYVSQLRKTLRSGMPSGAAMLTTVDPGYRLVVGADAVDATRFKELVDFGRFALAHGRAAEAHESLDEALALWRGPALADVADEQTLGLEVQRLDALHALALEDRIEAGIALGRHRELVGELDALVACHPLRERLWAQLMMCLYRSGRQADALRAYQRLRRRLAEELGLEPSSALSDLEHDILSHAPSLAGVQCDPPVRAARVEVVRQARVVVVDDVDARSSAGTLGLVGRDLELADLGHLLGRARLVTLLGPGGVGKTHLARAAAAMEQSRRRLTVVPLATLTDHAGIVDLLAQRLYLRSGEGDLLGSCVELLRADERLLVFDNCEHLLSAVRDVVAELLDACPDLSVLTTSRERLGLPVEQTYRLQPLAVPASDDATDLGSVPSVALFVVLAQRIRPEFSIDPAQLVTIAGIVRRLDGLPLAIELAAGRLSTLNIDDLGDRLDRALDLLHGGRTTADARHETLRSTVEWSYRLLHPDEQRLFRHLAIYPDGFDLVTAEQVAANLGGTLDPVGALAHLVDASMIAASLDGRVRYWMLDTLRSFGLDQLVAEHEHDAATERRQRWAADTARWIASTIDGPDEAIADARLRAETGNLRSAWRWARTTGDLDLCVDILGHLGTPATQRNLIEIAGWARELAGDPAVPQHRRGAMVLAQAADAAMSAGDLDDAAVLLERSMALPGGDEADRAVRGSILAALYLFRGDLDRTLPVALLAQHPATFGIATAAAALAAAYGGDLATAREINEHATRSSPSRKGWYHYVAGEIDGLDGRWADAEMQYRAAHVQSRIGGTTFLEGVASVGIVSAQVASEQYHRALLGYRELLDLWDRTGAWTQQWTTLRNTADLLDRLGDPETGALLRQAAADAPEAAAVQPVQGAGTRVGTGGTALRGRSREEVVDIARGAITHWLHETGDHNSHPSGTNRVKVSSQGRSPHAVVESHNGQRR